MSRAVTTRLGLYFGCLQLVFGATWVVYAVYLPQLGVQAGISKGTVSWILVGDQLIFALCDWAVGMAADRIAAVVGRLGKLFAVSAVSVLVVTLSIGWAERTLAREAAPQQPVPTEIPMATLLWFLGAVLLLQAGFQVHFFTNAQLLFAKYAQPAQLPALSALFWVGFAVVTPLAAVFVKELGGIACMTWCALLAVGSACAAAQASDVASLGIAQVICGGAWGGVMAGAVAAALAIGRRHNAGAAAGALFWVVALATMGRIALVAAHDDRVSAVASALPWLPSLSWLAAAAVLVPLARRITSATRIAVPPRDRISQVGPVSGSLGRLPTQATLLPRIDRGRTDQRRW